jgi:serine/threonine protein phosphatase PrpC
MEVTYFIHTLGQEVALFAKKYLPSAIKFSSSFKVKNYKQALIEAMFKASGRADLKEVTVDTLPKLMGCTACVALVTKMEVYIANTGDSRAVLYKRGKAIEILEDNK